MATKYLKAGVLASLVLGLMAWHQRDALHEQLASVTEPPPPVTTVIYSWRGPDGVMHFGQTHVRGAHRHLISTSRITPWLMPPRAKALPSKPLAPNVSAPADGQSNREAHPESSGGAGDLRQKVIERAIDPS